MKKLKTYQRPIAIAFVILLLSVISSNNVLAVGAYGVSMVNTQAVSVDSTVGEPAAVVAAGVVLVASVFVAAGAFVAGVVNGVHQAASGSTAALAYNGHKPYSSLDFSSYDNVN